MGTWIYFSLKKKNTLWNNGIGEPRVSCLPFPGRKGLRSNSSVSSSTHCWGSLNLDWKSCIRGQLTLGSMRGLITRPILHRLRPQRGAYFWFTSSAFFLAKCWKGRPRVTGLVGFVLGRPAKEKRHCYGKIHIHLVGWIRVCRISCIKLTIWEFIANNIINCF